MNDPYRSWRRAAALVALAAAAAGCLARPTSPEPQLIGPGRPVLFIGNSHTSVNDIPGIVQALADSAEGDRIAVMTWAVPGYALIDHWNDGRARQYVRRGGWAVVVLQQGWTPAGVCRDTLRLATAMFAREIREVGATPALYQTWAPATRPTQMLGTIESYGIAAADVGGMLLPAAAAWRGAIVTRPDLQLYLDGEHANATGAYLTALVMYGRILAKSPIGLPYRVRTRSGMDIGVSAADGAQLQQIADSVARAPDPTDPPAAPPVITSRC